MWSWSHTREAYHNVRMNIHNKEREELEEIMAEWLAQKEKVEKGNTVVVGVSNWDQEKHQEKKEGLKDVPSDVLADRIYDKASEFRACTNGGHQAYICPYGCHKVSFDREEQERAV